MATQTSADPQANRTRWGGILLTIGVISIVGASVISDLAIPALRAGMTGPERAQRVVDNATTFEATGWMYLYGGILAAVGAFFLVTRPLGASTRFPASAFWLFVAAGLLLYMVAFAWRTSGLVPAARAYATNPTLFDAFTGTFRVLGSVLTIAVVIGLVGVFWGEARAEGAVIPAWLAYTGVALTALRIVPVALSYSTSAAALDTGRILGYFLFYGSYLVVLALGTRIAMPNLKIAGTTAATRAERA